MKRVYFYALVVWVLFVILAIINGLVRNDYYPNELSELAKNQISSVILVFLVLGGDVSFFQ
ncbi:MAG: hypothetical protein KKD18_01835 [Nanoarchaeota archaeon]|nr:hypothetical protein [Nanoarchaeota archaeon]MBU0977133.1 hypothetical protein [Nanoarchaeota archaeon]